MPETVVLSVTPTLENWSNDGLDKIKSIRLVRRGEGWWCYLNNSKSCFPASNVEVFLWLLLVKERAKGKTK